MEQVAKAIGYLVYAVASADRHVSHEEKKVIHDLVNEHWKTLADKDDPFGAYALDFIDKIVGVLEHEHMKSEEAFDHFKKVYSENRSYFSEELKQFVIELCIKTGVSFNRMNKSELVLLSRIERFLKDKKCQ